MVTLLSTGMTRMGSIIVTTTGMMRTIIIMDLEVTHTCLPNKSPGAVCWRSASQVG